MPLNKTIRGHQAQFILVRGGVRQMFDTIRSVSISQDAPMSRHTYTGRPVPESDQYHMGWTGSLEMEVRNKDIEDFIDALINQNLNAIGITENQFMIREVYNDLTETAYVYTDAIFQYSRNQSTIEEKIMKSLQFQTADRRKVS